MGIEELASEIIDKFGSCQLCPEDGTFSLEQEEFSDEHWGDHYYKVENDGLELGRWVSCDGANDLRIFYNGKLVYEHCTYDGKDEGVLIYANREWEEKLKRLYDGLCLEQLNLL